MNIDPNLYKSFTEIYEIGENIVEVVRSAGAPMRVAERTAERMLAEGPHARRFRVIATRVLRGPTYKYRACIEELIKLPIDGREAHVWRDVTHYFSNSSADSVEACIHHALSFISSLQGRAHVFEDPNF
ncbi:hypothetical protein [Candidatus Binatus sp.]|jgi:hypothetical protein|uniref:hypothetical protein n=1 Tax=Candidatus Binatus sp. TaxID=2811406 RepID=UPI003D09D683